MHKTFVTAVYTVLFISSTAALAQQLPVTTTSKEARAHFELGRLDAFHYQFDQAVEHLNAAIALDSTFVLAHLHRAGSSKTVAEAQPYFDWAVKFKDRVSKGEQQMVDAFLAFLMNDEIDKAVNIFTELSDTYPDDPYLPTYLGLRYLRNLGQYDQAKKQFERALERDPQFVQVYNWLGYTALFQGDYAGAEKMFRRYIREAPGHPRPYDSMGELYLRQKQYEKAITYFEQALERYPAFEPSLQKLVSTQIRQQNRKFETAFGRQDAAAMAELYTQDGQLLPAGSSIVSGTEAIKNYWQGAFDSGLTGATLETVEVYRGADGATATEVGTYLLTSGDQEADQGKYVVIWEITPEGWKLHRDIWTTDQTSTE